MLSFSFLIFHECEVFGPGGTGVPGWQTKESKQIKNKIKILKLNIEKAHKKSKQAKSLQAEVIPTF